MSVGLTSLQLKIWLNDFSYAIYVPLYPECSFGSYVTLLYKFCITWCTKIPGFCIDCRICLMSLDCLGEQAKCWLCSITVPAPGQMCPDLMAAQVCPWGLPGSCSGASHHKGKSLPPSNAALDTAQGRQRGGG